MKDYFAEVSAIEPGKRRVSRLENERILRSISKRKKGYEQNWVAGKVSFMKTYKTKTFPKWFAKSGENVQIQVSIRLVPGLASNNAPVRGIKGIEVYYRFLKLVAKIEKEKKEDLKEEEKTEYEEFSTGKNIVETTNWAGSYLQSSQTADLFYRLLESIGIDRVKNVLNRTTKKQGE